MKILPLISIFLFISISSYAQPKLSIELYPNIFWVQSAVDDIPNYLLINPVLQFNVKASKLIEPYLKVGKAFVSGDDVETADFSEIGAGLRVNFSELLAVKNEWVQRHLTIFLFSDFSITDYGLNEELYPISVNFGNGNIIKSGVGATIRFGSRFSVGFDYFYINRFAVESNSGHAGGLRFGYHFCPLPEKLIKK